MLCGTQPEEDTAMSDVIDFQACREGRANTYETAAEAATAAASNAAALQRAQTVIAGATERGGLTVNDCYDLAEVIEQALTPGREFKGLLIG
jgi:hypothetical protein